MVNEGGSFAERTFSFVMRVLVSLVLPAWGLSMMVLGARSSAGWWIATGVVVLAIGVIFFAGSSLITPFGQEVENSVGLARPLRPAWAFVPSWSARGRIAPLTRLDYPEIDADLRIRMCRL